MNSQSKFTFLHRLIHWILAIAVSIQFATGFLRMEWMGKKAVMNAFEQNGIEASKDQMKAVYKTLREPMWQWHEVFAHVVIFAFLARIIYMLVKGIRFPNPFKSNISLKERFQGLTYVYFYAFIAVQAFTGICLEKGFLASYKEGIEDIHKLGIWWFPIFILLHLAGVLLAEHSQKKGITSKMIGGE
ncbi:MAG: cytochrome b/b6 domain-containing protein [Bacteroidetes bacterium]|nr:cytochrome b/b6 domain-containing protein [Bacteroidota bacterium]